LAPNSCLNQNWNRSAVTSNKTIMRSGTRCCVYCCHAAIALSGIIDAGESERRGLGLARGRAYDHRNIPGGSKPLGDLGDDFIHLRLVGKHQGQKKEWTSQPRSATSPNGQGASQTT
jgi:hypothetical protein